MNKQKSRSTEMPPPDAASILIALPFIALMLYLLFRNKRGTTAQPLPRVPLERWENWWPLDD